MRKLDLRIKVKSKEGKVFIPRLVGAGLYGSSEGPPSTSFLDGHEAVVLGCLERPFFVEEIFCRSDGGWVGERCLPRIVKVAEGDVVRHMKPVSRVGELEGYQVFFYVPVSGDDGRFLGHCEIRNVTYLFLRVREIYPDVKVVADL